MTKKRRKPAGKSVPTSGKFWIGVFNAVPKGPSPFILQEQIFQTAPRGTNAIPGEPDTIDWYTSFRYPIGGEIHSMEDGLRRRREAIEKLVAPHVTTQKTQHAIRFRGKQRYVKSIKSEEERHKVWYAIEVLQGIYHIQDAWRDGDINDAIRIAYCVGRLDVFLETSERFNSPLFKDVVQHYLAKEHGESKRGKTKLSEEQLPIVQAALSNNFGKKGWLKATTAELVDRHKLVESITPKAVSDYINNHGLRDKVAVAKAKRTIANK